MIVRSGEAIPPRRLDRDRGRDELHILVRAGVRKEVEELMERWREGPMEEPARPRIQPRSSPQIFNVRPWTEADGADLGRPEAIAGIEISQRLRTRRDAPGALVLLTDGRYAVTGDLLVAVGPRRQIAEWAAAARRRSPTAARRRPGGRRSREC